MYCGRKAGISSVSNLGDEDIEEKMSLLGDDFLIGRAVETKLKYGEGLQNESLVDVSKVIAELSSGVTVTDITKEMTLFTDFLDKDDLSRRRFFSYWRQLSVIVDSLAH